MKNILIIEDNADSADMLSMLLEFQGHTVNCASSGRAGIALAEKLDPDIIITDLGLPDMDGLDLLRKVSSVVTPSRCTVVALTGQDGTDIRHEAEKAGANHFFVKGNEINNLLSFIDKQG